MLRRATALKRICDRQRVQNAHDAGYSTTYAVVSMLLIPVIIGIFIIFHVAVMPGEKP